MSAPSTKPSDARHDKSTRYEGEPMDMALDRIDAVLREPRWSPRFGWHDDHAHRDGKPDYMPAVMQTRAEFARLLEVIRKLDLRDSCLQLGLGNCHASHALWLELFDHVLTIDTGACLLDAATRLPGLDTHSSDALKLAGQSRYDFLFIDAGHSYDDVARDYFDYAPLVRRGGLIAFHDALPRAAYPEVGVHSFLATLPNVTIVGDKVGDDEVGTAWVYA